MIANHISVFWKDVFKDQVFIDAWCKSIDELNAQLFDACAGFTAALSRTAIQPLRRKRWLPLRVAEDSVGASGIPFNTPGYTFDGTLLFDHEPSSYGFSVPLPAGVVNVGFVVNNITDPSLILQNGYDFKVDATLGRLVFKVNPFMLPFARVPTENGLELLLTLRSVDFDYKDLDKIYGLAVETRLGSTEYYKRVMNALWELRMSGATTTNTIEFMSSVLDTDPAKVDGVVTNIFEEPGKKFVLVGETLHSAPANANFLVAVGDTVKRNDALFDSVMLYADQNSIPSSVMPGLHIGSWLAGADIKGGVLAENADKPFPGIRWLLLSTTPGAALVEDVTTADYTYLVQAVQGNDLYMLVDNALAGYKLIATRWELPFYGAPSSVEAFRNRLAFEAATDGYDIGDVVIADNHGGEPPTINMFDFYWRHVLSLNGFLIVARMDLAPEGVDAASLMSRLGSLIPANQTMMTFMSLTHEDMCLSGVSDAVDAFHVAEETATINTGITEHQEAEASL